MSGGTGRTVLVLRSFRFTGRLNPGVDAYNALFHSIEDPAHLHDGGIHIVFWPDGAYCASTNVWIHLQQLRNQSCKRDPSP